MRRPPVFLLAMIAARVACAQGGLEREHMERLLKVDPGLEYDMRKSTGGILHSRQSSSTYGKEYLVPDKNLSKGFNTRDYSGSKESWFSRLRFGTKEAATRGKYEIGNAQKKAETKTAETKTLAVKDARESAQGAPAKPFAQSDLAYADRREPGGRLRRGASQDRYDSENGVPADTKPLGWGGDLRKMSIDDIRELLNKNK